MTVTEPDTWALELPLTRPPPPAGLGVGAGTVLAVAEGEAAAAGTGPPTIEATVYGFPVGQGNIRSLGKGRPSVHQNAKTLLPWRVSVKLAIEEQCGQGGGITTRKATLDGPLRVDLVFTVAKPKSAPKRRRTWPITRPDLDHLARAVLDAITQSGAIRDDSQAVDLRARKVYPGEGIDALASPGVVVRVWALDGAP